MKKAVLIIIIFALCLLSGYQINDIIDQNINLADDIYQLMDIVFDLLIISILVYEWMKILKKQSNK